ncbi:hypothetical protein FEM48_Zijuj01G0050100 [Ziziphus jujuba var. spinosa]|uniref:Protein BZR1 homolog n=1 Tax=Ziziphus jujuba var. spinosa TaxID=714518 RepID=A0A978VZ95_ZIZJJ|nr:hypothetical protein FEM48_Zijuj01G0050100 [Ziziphus jujuba var. spinosa]
MTSGTRMPTWKERENNKKRERRRRAIAAKIYAGLRMYGNYKLPKHCDNNEVLKALCNEAGWTVEEDGTTYRKIYGVDLSETATSTICALSKFTRSNWEVSPYFNRDIKPVCLKVKSQVLKDIVRCLHLHFDVGCKPVDRMDIMGGSTSASPCSSYQPSPCASYNPSPASSSFPSPVSSHYTANANGSADANSLIPWLKNLSSGSSSASSKFPHHLFVHGGSISAPVTPPLSSPTCRTPRTKGDWDDPVAGANWAGQHYSLLPSSTPPSPGRQVLPDSGWFAGLEIPQSGPSSPTFSLVSRNPFGLKEAFSAGGSRMWTPGQSGTCSPAVAAGVDHTADVPMSDGIAAEFAFGSSATGLVKPWEGETIEECVSDDLELTLGNPRTR